MKNINVKERIAAIRKAHTYGPTPLEEAILCLIEDLTGANDEPQEPSMITPETEVTVTTEAEI